MTPNSKPQEDSIRNPRHTWEGCSVLLDINDGDRLAFARLSPGSTVKIGNTNCSLQPLIGCPFGSLFQIETGANGPYLSRVLSALKDNRIQENEECTIQEELKDNRAIIDNNTAQSLTGDDIDAMRRQGAKGDEIVKALIANSATFEKKTVFSQEKYRLKKQKKYAPRVLLRRPFTRSICETYFKKYPARIGYLRVDTLSLMLSMANIGSCSDVLVVDMVGGILTGAVAERLGGTGFVCNTHFGKTPYSMDIVRIFNFSDKICERIVRCPSSDLHSAANGTASETSEHKDASNLLTNVEDNMLSSTNESPDISPSMTKPCKSVKAGEKASEELIKLWKQNGFSNLIIAAPDMDPWRIVQELLPLLAYSAPFAIYHQYLQPLATCMHNLQLARMAINMQVSEPWLREYQVLPSRTHPCMQMSASGGYILSGTRIFNSEQILL